MWAPQARNVIRSLAAVSTIVGLAALAAGCGGSTASKPRAGTTPAATVSRPPVRRVARGRPARRSTYPAAVSLGLPPVPPGPVPGYVLIADRNNNRLLIVSPAGRVVWSFPEPGDVRPGQSFRDPDDAFFTPGYHRLITNEEFNDSLAQIDLRTRRIVWSYGRAGVAGSGPGELSNPDDAYRLPNGVIQVADIQNCRVLRITETHRILRSFGSPVDCVHDPPRFFHSPNGATPLPDGGTLVTEIGGWVDRLTASGRLVYSVRTPTTYPSDAQLLPNGDILVAGFNTPGRIDEITPGGRIVWTYGPPSGPGSLDRPSLAVRWPNGMIAATDDWHHRVVVIDPRTKQIVWQYGHLDIASSAPGYLSKPDGLDLLAAPFLRPAPVQRLVARRIGSLPRPASRIAVAALPGGRLIALGGLAGGSSIDWVLAGKPGSLRRAGRLPSATHDAAAARLGSSVYLFGGGEQVSSPAIVRVDPATGRALVAGTLGEPLSDLGAVAAGNVVYIVGGYTGSRFATAILRFRPGEGAPRLVTRLPTGLRYAGVAMLSGRIYVAGGVTTSGESRAVYAVDPQTGSVTQAATLPAPLAHAPLVALGRFLYLVGGSDTNGNAVASILRIDPETGTVARAGSLPAPLADAAATRVGRQIVVLGGAGSAASSAVLELAPAVG
jgi:outer membrane protein assembly factor BamB